MVADSVPVLVGAGQAIQKDAPPRDALPPMGLAAEAARRALADAGSAGLAKALDTVVVTRLFSDSSPFLAHSHGRTSNPPRAVARDVGADPARAVYAEVGGNTPQKYVNLVAERIARGEAEAALLAGAECLATQKRAGREGIELDWSDEVGGDFDDRGYGARLASEHEIAHGIAMPVHVYPLFEQAIRRRMGHTLETHLRHMGELFAPFSEVASRNPYAYFPVARSARELATPGADNPFIALPYPKLMNARDAVDQGAALVMTSAGKARELGIDPSQWVFLHGCSDANEKLPISERVDYASSPAIPGCRKQAFAMAGIEVGDVEHIDVYSCFPSAVEVTCDALDLAHDDPRSLTLTGGLPFFGGPGNNYSMHAIAEAVARCREAPRSYALVTANGGYLSKHSLGIYSARPFEDDWHRPEPATLQAEIDAMPGPAFTEEPDGAAEIETYTVAFGREGPERGIVIGRLSDGRRFLANTPAGRELLDAMAREECLGRRGQVEPGRHGNVFRFNQ